KDKYYSTLDGKSKGASLEYLKKQGPISIPTDVPKLNLRQLKTELETRLRSSGSLSQEEKAKIASEIANLDKQLKQTPEGIDRQIRVQEELIRNISRLDPKYAEMSLTLARLKEYRQNIDTVQKADFAADTELISSELAKLKEERGVFLATTKIDTKIDVNNLKRALNDLNAKLNESNTNTLAMTDKKRKQLETKQARLIAEIEKQEDFKQMQDTISALESMTPENREKFKGELQGKSEAELESLRSSYEMKFSAFKNNPAMQDIIGRDINEINSAIKVEQTKKEIDKYTNLVGLQKEHMKRQITGDMTKNNIYSLREGIIKDKELNFRFAKQAANEKAASAAAQRTASK
ncbi:hypothetical protein EBS02_07275, partial [bacterium]|nr:hypothetical protein [bacterium]